MALQRSDKPLVDFERPPVVETVLGVQFTPLNLMNAHLGAFWKRLGAAWPNVKDAPPLPPQFERFGEGVVWGSALLVQVCQESSSRIQIRNADGDKMIQAQRDRFHYNWLGHEGGEYPRYKSVRAEFDKLLEEFRRFVREESLGHLQPNQWEVTYVNHLPKGTVWAKSSEWPELFRRLIVFPDKLASTQLESFGGEWHYRIEPQRGRLHVNLQHGRRKDTEVLVLTLTARGPVDERDPKGTSLDDGLNFGREAIVKAFKELTSEAAHEYWGVHEDA